MSAPRSRLPGVDHYWELAYLPPFRASTTSTTSAEDKRTLPMKSPVDGGTKSVMPEMFRAAEAMGTIHNHKGVRDEVS